MRDFSDWRDRSFTDGGLNPVNRANVERLRACVRPHDYQSVRRPGEGATRGRYRRRKCGGEVSDQAFWHYREGLKDGLRAAEARHCQAEAAALAQAAQDGAAP